MESAGLSTELETGTKIFCKPNTYAAARNAIQGIEGVLRPYHVIVTEEFRPLVTQIVKAFPRALKVKCKEESVIARIGHAGVFVPLSRDLESVQSSSTESKDVAPETPKDECKTGKQKKAKSTKGKNSPKAEQGDGKVLPDHSLPLDSLLQSLPPVNPMDPAFAFPMIHPTLPAPLEADPAFIEFVQAMEQQQAVFNHAVMLNLHAQRFFQDNLLFAAELDHQLSNKA
jgi:hypothetical protein